MKYSYFMGQLFGSFGNNPDGEQTAFWITSLGRARVSFGLFCNKCSMISCQIGAAPVMPEAIELMRELSLFPTHVATTYEGVYPNVQLSRKSFVVPVFAETIL